jgi:hypothetical protein
MVAKDPQEGWNRGFYLTVAVDLGRSREATLSTPTVSQNGLSSTIDTSSECVDDPGDDGAVIWQNPESSSDE